MNHIKKFNENSNEDLIDVELLKDIFHEMEYEFNANYCDTLEGYNNTEHQNQDQVHTFTMGDYKYNLNYHIDVAFPHFTAIMIRDTIRHWRETESKDKFKPIEKWLVENIFPRIIDMLNMIIAYTIVYKGADTEVVIYIFNESQKELLDFYRKRKKFKILS